MEFEQGLILGILATMVGMFLWGRWRHDMVALGALLACVVFGLVPSAVAFSGFGHPAVITVACVLVLSRALQASGAVDLVVSKVMPANAGPLLTIAVLTGIGALLSGFMNNVGALALLMPVGLQVAQRQQLPPGRVLMPLAFGSILGGMTTMVGTPPNLIVSGFRSETGMGSFTMFDFTPVGIVVAVAGVLFVVLLARYLVPARERSGAEEFDTGTYITEARVTKGSKAVGKTLREVEDALEEHEAQVLGLVRNEVRVNAPQGNRVVQAGDILVIEAEPEELGAALSDLDLKLEEAKPRAKADTVTPEDTVEAGQDKDDSEGEEEEEDNDKDNDKEEKKSDDDNILVEVTILPGSALVDYTASRLRLRTRYGINLLAVSRLGRRSVARLRTMRFRAGDVLLLQGAEDAINDFASEMGGVPLAARSLRIPDKRKTLLSSLILLLAVAGAALGLLPAAISFAGGVLATMVLRTLPLRAVYDAIDWPVIVLLGALIPVATAMETTGTAALVAGFLLDSVAQGHAVIGLAVVLVVTMTLSDLMNNAATAAIMCPVAIGAASQLGVSADPYLMAVAVGASCAFLTPIGHQNNTLILGPGGFRFGDYWRLGLPLEVLVVLVAVPMLLWVWPL
ncbi:SLC13 family permease [Thioalkalivibrio sp. XN279]|uniref:SLC13 family permease n=1 Tax=Thioalkalivibrio sp. XN279 TaxID=2714953 RepID=UPI00140C5066|nr:SLC13 family permease [Thioalkalivibrio sp. XN279]NHA15608.1 SLC13 family permease [Thioalkalivibrio sp. XN279]